MFRKNTREDTTIGYLQVTRDLNGVRDRFRKKRSILDLTLTLDTAIRDVVIDTGVRLLQGSILLPILLMFI